MFAYYCFDRLLWINFFEKYMNMCLVDLVHTNNMNYYTIFDISEFVLQSNLFSLAKE